MFSLPKMRKPQMRKPLASGKRPMTKRPTLGMYPGVKGGVIKRKPMKATPAMKRRALSRMK